MERQTQMQKNSLILIVHFHQQNGHPDKKTYKKISRFKSTEESTSVFNLKDIEYTLYSLAKGTSSKKEHTLGHKVNIRNMRKLKEFFVSYEIILE